MLCALVLGVLVMHHTVSTDSGPAASGHSAVVSGGTEGAMAVQSDDGHEMPSGTHDLLHLCLAILIGAFALVFSGLWRPITVVLSRRLRPGRGGSTPARDPPASGGRLILLTVCVLRV